MPAKTRLGRPAGRSPRSSKQAVYDELNNETRVGLSPRDRDEYDEDVDDTVPAGHDRDDEEEPAGSFDTLGEEDEDGVRVRNRGEDAGEDEDELEYGQPGVTGTGRSQSEGDVAETVRRGGPARGRSARGRTAGAQGGRGRTSGEGTGTRRSRTATRRKTGSQGGGRRGNRGR